MVDHRVPLTLPTDIVRDIAGRCGAYEAIVTRTFVPPPEAYMRTPRSMKLRDECTAAAMALVDGGDRGALRYLCALAERHGWLRVPLTRAWCHAIDMHAAPEFETLRRHLPGRDRLTFDEFHHSHVWESTFTGDVLWAENARYTPYVAAILHSVWSNNVAALTALADDNRDVAPFDAGLYHAIRLSKRIGNDHITRFLRYSCGVDDPSLFDKAYYGTYYDHVPMMAACYLGIKGRHPIIVPGWSPLIGRARFCTMP